MKLPKQKTREILQRAKQKPGYKEIKKYHTIALGTFLIIVVLLCSALTIFPIRDFHVLAEFIAVSGILVFLYISWKIKHPSVLLGTVKDVKDKTIRGILYDTQYVVATEKGKLIARDLKDQTYSDGSRVYVVSELTNYIAEQEEET